MNDEQTRLLVTRELVIAFGEKKVVDTVLTPKLHLHFALYMFHDHLYQYREN